MLYKPTSPSPYAESIVLNRDTPTGTYFTGYCINTETSKIVKYSDLPARKGGIIYRYPVKKDYIYDVQFFIPDTETYEDWHDRIAIGFNAESLSAESLSDEGDLVGVIGDEDIPTSITGHTSIYSYQVYDDGYLYVDVGRYNINSNSIINTAAKNLNIKCKGQLDTDMVGFSCSMIGSSVFDGARLKLSNSSDSFYLDSINNPSLMSYDKTGNSANIRFELDSDILYQCYSISNTGTVDRNDNLSETTRLFNGHTNHVWQARLYEAGSLNDDSHRSNIWLGYGVVENLDTQSSSGNHNDQNYFYINQEKYLRGAAADRDGICFKVRPHTNIYFPNATGGTSSVVKNGVNYNLKHLFNNYDDNARYYIKVNEGYYRIRDYRFYSPPSSSAGNSFATKDDFDSYGEPKFGYIVVDYTNGSDAHAPILKAGDQYEIYCNYIDSDEFYFSVIDEPTITFTGTLNENLKSTEDVPVNVKYSNLSLNGTYNHSEGVGIEKYDITLYKSTGVDWELVEQTGDIYDGHIVYNYDLLMGGNIYKAEINVQDSLGYKIKEELYLNVDYRIYNIEKAVDVRYYQKHDSIIIDWSDGTSIDCDHYEVYKKIGNNPKLHLVCKTTDYRQNIVEDFAVGNLCDYTYYVYPVVTRALLTPTATYSDALYEYDYDSYESDDYLYACEGYQTQRFEVVGGETYCITGCNIGQLDKKNFPFIICFKGIDMSECVYGHYSDENYSTSNLSEITDTVEYNDLKIKIPEGINVIYVNSTSNVEISVRRANFPNGGVAFQLQSPISNTINFNYGATTIFGLIQDKEDLNTYTIDYNDMWRFEFNMEDTGTTLNMDKTFVDSQNRFPKMMGGNRKYNSISVKGLIGYYDCKKGEYIETYDLLEDWENFATNNCLKLLKDRRGRLVPCDIESSSYEYMDVFEAPATVSFSARQLESLDNITILGRALILNPIKNNILTTSDGEVLTDSATQVLTSKES